jgi:hypothetical protein
MAEQKSGNLLAPPEKAKEGRVVYYEYCISLVFLTLRRPSGLYHLRPGERGVWKGLPYVALSLLLGWWGIPWGLIYTPLTLWTNLTGGVEVSPVRWGPLAGDALKPFGKAGDGRADERVAQREGVSERPKE